MQKSHPAWFDFPAVVLLVIAALIASTRLVITEWIPDLHVIVNLTNLGLLLGMLLGYSRFNKVGTNILTLGYSLILVPWVIYASISPFLTFDERLYEMGARIQAASDLFLAKEAVEDPLLLLIFLGLLFWVGALYAGFALLRHQNGLGALFPSLLIILVVQYNDHKPETPLWMLGFYFLFAFLLLARFDYLLKHEQWRAKHFFIIPDVKIDQKILSTVAIVVLLIFTWNLPSSDAEWKSIIRWWDKTTYKFETARRNLDNLFSAVDNPAELRGSAFYGASLTLGERTYQGTNIITEVNVSDPEEIENPPPRFYWRVRSYDTYANGSWSASEGRITEFLSAQTPLLLPVDRESEIAKVTFTNKAEQTVNLIMPAQSYWADIDTFATYTELPEGALDLNLLSATKRLGIDEQYAVQAALLSPTVSQLRSAGTTYPDWVIARYLQLPDDLPPSIPELAREITRGHASPYDKARVITIYLRNVIEYSETIPPPPAGRDPLEWFLFTWQEGFCNYSASAQVVMLRSLGIPARLVVGFSQGEQVGLADFRVLQKDAHAWPEVYFPEIGWVEFEPTGNQTSLIRPQGEIEAVEDSILPSDLVEDEVLLEETPLPTPTPPALAPDASDDLVAEKKVSLAVLFWGMIILITVVVLLGIWQIRRKQFFLTRALRQVIRIYEKNERRIPKWVSRWLAWLEARPIERAFHAINRSLRWLYGEVPLHLTPLERAAMLTELLPEASEAIMQLLHEHEKTLFSPEAGDIEIAQDAAAQITWAAVKKKMQKDSEKTEA